MKGLLLAGGTGSRLRPATLGVSKQLLPVFDKPMIYYPLTTLMLAGLREILVIVAAGNREPFVRTLGDGSQFGLSLHWCEQPHPGGIAQALLLAEPYLQGEPVMLALGDNLLYGAGLTEVLAGLTQVTQGANVLGYRVADPERYGVLAFEGDRVVDIVEKPLRPPSSWAVPGLYAYDATACERASTLTPSARGELEITDLHRSYLHDGQLRVTRLDRGFGWLDMGTPEHLQLASAYVAAIQERQGVLLGSPEEVAWRAGWIDAGGVKSAAEHHAGTDYGERLEALLHEGLT